MEDPLEARLLEVREEVRSLIRAKGLRATGVRIDVLVALHEAGGPLTHEPVSYTHLTLPTNREV